MSFQLGAGWRKGSVFDFPNISPARRSLGSNPTRDILWDCRSVPRSAPPVPALWVGSALGPCGRVCTFSPCPRGSLPERSPTQKSVTNVIPVNKSAPTGWSGRVGTVTSWDGVRRSTPSPAGGSSPDGHVSEEAWHRCEHKLVGSE